MGGIFPQLRCLLACLLANVPPSRRQFQISLMESFDLPAPSSTRRCDEDLNALAYLR